MNLGASELLLIFFVVLLLFGGKRLPELARSLGKGLAEFRRTTQNIQREVASSVSDIPDSRKISNSLPALNAHPDSQPRTPPKPPDSTS